MTTSGDEVVLRVKGLAKAFPGVQALEAVSLEVRRGTVHALMGENGAGKSTFMRVLAGLCQPDAGEIQFEGRPVRIPDPGAALRLGIAMIHQELMPFPHLSVAENLFAGQEPGGRFSWWVDRGAMHRRAGELLASLHCRIDPAEAMRRLSVAQMQTVEIARALLRRAKVVIMDEPTSAISESEVEPLFEIIAGLKRQGVAVIYISHKMEEVFRVADVVTVLRDGRHVATLPRAAAGPDQLIELMVGRELARPGLRSAPSKGPVALSVRGLWRAGKFRAIDFDLRRGEILGVAGLLGAGRTELVSALFGMPPADGGEIQVHGAPRRIRNPRDALALGLALVSEDRKRYGLVLDLPVKENLTLGKLGLCCRGPFVDGARERALAESQARRLGVRAASLSQRARFLSGGNQQKVVLGRSLLGDPDIVILDEPTRGIDVGAKAEIYDLVRDLARQGKAVLLVSSELPEILRLCDRVLVMRQGEFAAELDPGLASQQEILRHAMPL